MYINIRALRCIAIIYPTIHSYCLMFCRPPPKPSVTPLTAQFLDWSLRLMISPGAYICFNVTDSNDLLCIYVYSKLSLMYIYFQNDLIVSVIISMHLSQLTQLQLHILIMTPSLYFYASLIISRSSIINHVLYNVFTDSSTTPTPSRPVSRRKTSTCSTPTRNWTVPTPLSPRPDNSSSLHWTTSREIWMTNPGYGPSFSCLHFALAVYCLLCTCAYHLYYV